MILYRWGFFLMVAIETAKRQFLRLDHRPGPIVDVTQENSH